ncbi:MAG: NFACT family protein, partial [Deltaproteobacteria bacterium]|nr:NFACT family protein [Deltaproteobacteria bacterium]
MDQHSLELVCADLKDQLRGCFITKIHQMTPWHLLLRLRGAGGGERRLLISVAPRDPGLHLTSRRYLNPPRPLRFCAYLRRHLQGARVQELEKVAGDRILILHAARRNDGGRLIIELTGRVGNLVYCRAEDQLIGALMLEKGGRERLRPGQAYSFPEKPPGITGQPDFLLARLNGGQDPAALTGEQRQQLYDDWFFPRYREYYGRRELNQQLQALSRHLKKIDQRIRKLRAEESDKQNHLEDGRLGDLLKNCLGRMTRGMTSIRVVDYWSPDLPELEISLDPALSPQANLARFYNLAGKA